MQCNKNKCPTGITTHNEDLQYGLNPENKAIRVMNYAKNIHNEVCMIAHSCGVAEPRKLERKHARIVLPNRKLVGMEELYPETLLANYN